MKICESDLSEQALIFKRKTARNDDLLIGQHCNTACPQSFFKRFVKAKHETSSAISIWKHRESSSSVEFSLEKQLQAWKENPIWTDQSPFIKEVISKRDLVDEGMRQVVDLEQAALWKFLWRSGTITVHVVVDQNKDDYSMKFKQVRTEFMKRFEGFWKVEPVLIDEELCHPFKPKTLKDYISYTKGKGRIGSRVSLEQIIEPAIVPPPPISWYLRGITIRTTEMLLNDLVAEAAKIRGVSVTENSEGHEMSVQICDESRVDELYDIKDRWALRRRNARQCHRRQSTYGVKSRT